MGIRELFRPRYYERTVYIGSVIDKLNADDMYRTQPALRSVISFLADNVAGLPLKCYVRQPDGGRVRDRDSSLALLLSHPNAWSTGHELIRATVSEYLLHDSAIWLVIPDRTLSGWTAAVIPSAWATIKTRDGLEADYVKVVSPYTNEIKLDSKDLLMFNGWSPYGSAVVSPRIDALKDVLREQVNAWNFRNGIWKNQGRVTQWISRPQDAPWGDGAKDRFAKSWKNRFAGDDATDTGGTPLLEDGMRLETITFNAREAQWVEATRLSREDVCSVYHVNPGLIYHTDAQTYASAKDNARALYSDTLAPLLDMIEERINSFLVPKLGLDETHYCEFDLAAKLQGSFEEQAAVMSSAVGAPWMTRNEARAMRNLPLIDGGDELVTPLNVLIGGQASPQDSIASPYNALEPAKKSQPTRVKGAPEDADAREIKDALVKFFERQARSVIPRLKKDRFPDWWDSDRWEKELADDLEPIFYRQAVKRGRRVTDSIGGEFDGAMITAYIATMAMGKSKAINNVTYRELRTALDGDISDDALGSTVQGVFDKAVEVRAETSGVSFATAITCFATLEACQQNAGNRTITKQWVVTSDNPRPSHAMMDGETVPYDEEFSNGARYPGEHNLDPEETCNCQCQMDILI